MNEQILCESVLLPKVVEKMCTTLRRIAYAHESCATQPFGVFALYKAQVQRIAILLSNPLHHRISKLVSVERSKQFAHFATSEIHELREQMKRVQPLARVSRRGEIPKPSLNHSPVRLVLPQCLVEHLDLRLKVVKEHDLHLLEDHYMLAGNQPCGAVSLRHQASGADGVC